MCLVRVMKRMKMKAKGLEKITRSPVTIKLKFKDRSEAVDLADELSTWTPHGGWSENAAKLFAVLKG